MVDMADRPGSGAAGQVDGGDYVSLAVGGDAQRHRWAREVR